MVFLPLRARRWGNPTSNTEFLVKILGGLFAAVVAPILTGIVLFFIQKKLDDPKPDAHHPKAATALAGPELKSDPATGKAAEKPGDIPKPAQTGDLASATTRSVQRPPLNTKEVPKPSRGTNLAIAATPFDHRPALERSCPVYRGFSTAGT